MGGGRDLDLATGMASVLGDGTVTVRHDGVSRVLSVGAVVPIADLAARADAGGGVAATDAARNGGAGPDRAIAASDRAARTAAA